MASASLNERQRAFANEYVVDFNGTQAAIRAGYSAKTAKAQASRLLTNVDVQKAVRKAIDRRDRRTEITQDRILQELGRIAFAQTPDVVSVKDGTVKVEDTDLLSEDQTAAIAEIAQNADGSLRVKMHSKTQALTLLARHKGMLTDVVEHKGQGVPVPVHVHIGNGVEDPRGAKEAED